MSHHHSLLQFIFPTTQKYNEAHFLQYKMEDTIIKDILYHTATTTTIQIPPLLNASGSSSVFAFLMLAKHLCSADHAYLLPPLKLNFASTLTSQICCKGF